MMFYKFQYHFSILLFNIFTLFSIIGLTFPQSGIEISGNWAMLIIANYLNNCVKKENNND